MMTISRYIDLHKGPSSNCTTTKHGCVQPTGSALRFHLHDQRRRSRRQSESRCIISSSRRDTKRDSPPHIAYWLWRLADRIDPGMHHSRDSPGIHRILLLLGLCRRCCNGDSQRLFGPGPTESVVVSAELPQNQKNRSPPMDRLPLITENAVIKSNL